MGKRRDDIVAEQRVQIALEVLSPHRTWGSIPHLQRTYGLSRQGIYDIAAKGAHFLRAGMKAGAHGPQPNRHDVAVNRNRLQRSVLALTEAGASQRSVVACLAEVLDTRVSLGWVNGQLAQLETAAARINQQWQPAGNETLSGDEMFANGQPNLLIVGNESLYIYALTRQEERDGDTWGCLLLDAPASDQFASDAGTGLAAGVKEAEIETHQLDWDHLLRPMWGQVARLERRAYAALQKVEERADKFDQAYTPQRLAQHLHKWEQLSEQAEEKINRLDTFYPIAREVDNWFALVNLETGRLSNAEQGRCRLRALGQQLEALSGRIYHKLAKNLQNWAAGLFNYQPALQQALAPLQVEYGPKAIVALSRLWQCEADEKRRRLSLPEQQKRQQIWQQSLDEALTLLGEARLWSAWEALCPVLERSWRGSMLAECVNSLLRPVLDRRKHTDQGCLEMFRFLHNARPFLRGKRAGNSPAQIAGLDVPNDPFALLGLLPKVSS